MLDRGGVRGGVAARTVPGVEPVTFRSRQSGSNQAVFSSYTLATAKRKKLSKSDVELLGGVQAAQGWLRWQLWQEWLDAAVAIVPATLPPPAPKVGDVVEDAAGVGYVVKDVEIKLFGEVFSLLCLKKV